MISLALPLEEVNSIVKCANKGCKETFEKKTHNQIYHSDECCRQATNRRIMEKYYANRDRKQGKARLCKQCKSTKLSRYNESEVCAVCESKIEEKKNNSVLNMLFNTSLIA